MSTAPFTAEETTDILRFLGYPDWQSLAQSIQLGYPAASQPLFLVRDSQDRISVTARIQVRRFLCELRTIENQLSDARTRLRASRLGELTLNPDERRALREEYSWWMNKLADQLGVVPNPYSQMEYRGIGGGMNAKVVG